MKLKIPRLMWDGGGEREIDFPNDWDVHFCPPRGWDRPPMDDAQIRKAFDEPIGTKRIHTLARGKKEVVIIFDDITRPTPVHQLAPYVLEELREAGIGDEQVRFVVASGTHGAHDNKALRAKLGQEILERFFVFQHNPYENCVSVGATRLGTPLSVNREVMSCDFKIGIGSILPHPQAGFGGGGKLILPGVSHIDSIDCFHRTIADSPPSTVGMGNWDENPMRQETDDAARLAGLDVAVDALFNGRCQVTDLLVGDPVLAHHEGVQIAKEIYATELTKDADVVVTNAHAKAGEAAIAIILGIRSIKPSGGTIVMVIDCPAGQVVHYMLRRFGKEYGGRQYAPRGGLPPQFRLIILNPQPDMTSTDLFVDPASVIWAKDWREVKSRLREFHPDGARVAVYPDGTAQYPAP
ncbi:MAG TPA: lactate racemase domain-containing protein [Dehalococcoidia bacterium]|nr:lactate racemase domain-containing protein [Dehalococcoidia bacterium]